LKVAKASLQSQLSIIHLVLNGNEELDCSFEASRLHSFHVNLIAKHHAPFALGFSDS
jgi:hypothetical protein